MPSQGSRGFRMSGRMFLFGLAIGIWNFPARDRTLAIAVTQAAAVTMLDP